MTNKTINWNQNIIIFGIPLLIIASMIILAKSSLFMIHPKELSIGITFDLILSVPLVYLFLIRKKQIPKITAVPFFITGIIIASFVIPKDNQFYLTQIKNWVLPFVETTVLIIVVFKVRTTIRNFKIQKGLTLDFYAALKNATKKILPHKISTAFATEIAVIYYGFFAWKKRRLNSNEFSYHRKSGTIALLSVFIFLILIETSVAHVLLQKWDPTVALIISILSIYTALQVFGIVRSLSKRPISIENEKLELRYGLFSESTIMIKDIESIELSTKSINLDKVTLKLSPLSNLEEHNIIINLKNENLLFGFYGLRKKYNTIAFFVDDEYRFKQEIEYAIQQYA